VLQLVYRIQIKEPNTLSVRLEEKGSRRILYIDHLRLAMPEADRAAVNFLIEIHRKAPHVSRNLDTASFQCIEVPASLSNEAMRLMAKTGKLFFQDSLISLHPIAAELIWKGEKHSERSCTIEAFIDGEPLSGMDLVFPGKPYWMIKKGIFRPLKTEISWSWLEKCLKGLLLLEGALQKKFLEEGLPILWKKKEEVPLEVFPELVLQDATGSFAHLWMNYPGLGRVAFEDFSPTLQGKSRLKEAELLWEKDLLETAFIRKVVGATRYFCPGDQVSASLRFLLELGWKVVDCKGRRVYRQTRTSLSVKEIQEKIVLSGELCFQEKLTSLKASFPRLWLELDEHSVGLLDHKMLEGVQTLLEDAVYEEGAFSLPKQKISLLAPFLDRPEVNWSEQLFSTLSKMTKGVEESLPSSSFQGTLLAYQQKGLDWISHLHRFGFSGLLADDMGLGKTVQVLAFFSRLRKNLPILIVAPTSLVLNWQREIERFLPSFPVYIHSGEKRLKDPLEIQKAPIVITSYALLRQEISLLEKVSFEVALLDESQAIKNKDTQTAKAAGRLQSRFRLCLSGTPIENRVEEFIAQFQFLLPNLLSTKDSLELLKRKSKPFFLRRRKADVNIELPEKREQILWLEMTELQAKMYEETHSQFKRGLLQKVEKDGASMHRMEILEAILRLRQICADPRLLKESFLGAKAELLQEEISSMLLEKQKVLVYSQFTSFLSFLKKDLSDFSPLYLDGSMSFEQRGREVERFQDDPNAQLFLISLKAGGAGLNLTAADTVILLDPWWNDAVEQQAIDRAHRLGQTKKILAKRYLTPGSIEEKMLQLKQKKQQIADLLLDTQEEAFSWSAEDLLHLLF